MSAGLASASGRKLSWDYSPDRYHEGSPSHHHSPSPWHHHSPSPEHHAHHHDDDDHHNNDDHRNHDDHHWGWWGSGRKLLRGSRVNGGVCVIGHERKLSFQYMLTPTCTSPVQALNTSLKIMTAITVPC